MSAYAHRPQTRFLATPSAHRVLPSELLSAGETMGWIRLEQRRLVNDADPSTEDEVFIPGSGIAKPLYSKW